MSDWLIDMIADTEFDDKQEAKIDSLDNVYKVKETAQFLKISPDSLNNMDSATFEKAYTAVTDSIKTDSLRTDSLTTITDVPEDYNIFPDIKTSKPKGSIPGWIEKMSIKGKEIAEGGEDKGFRISPEALAFKLPPTEGMEYFDRVLYQYDKEISKESDVLLSPGSYSDERFGEKLMQLNTNLRVRDNLIQQLEDVYKTIPETEDYRGMRERYLSHIESNPLGRRITAGNEDFVLQTPSSEMQSQPLSPLDNDPEPLMALSRMVDPLNEGPPDFLPIPEEIAKLEGFPRNPFTSVDDALVAIKDYQADSSQTNPVSFTEEIDIWDPQYDYSDNQ